MYLQPTYNQQIQPYNSQIQPAMGGFFGRLWKRVKNAVSAAWDSILGGGSIWSIVLSGIGGFAAELRIGTIAEEYPLSIFEEDHLVLWFQNVFAITIANLANKVDAVINVSARITANTNPLVIQKANEVLKAISVFRAYNNFIKTKGEKSRSDNYINNKIDFTEFYLNILEKAVLGYVEKNDKDGFKLIVQKFIASTITKVETTTFFWQSNKVEAPLKLYVPIQTLGDEVDVIDVDVNSSDPSTTVNDIITIADKKTSTLTKGILIFGAGYFFSKIVNN